MFSDFQGKVALVTGASSGIGREAARAFAARGALVYGADLNDRGLAETQDLIEQGGGAARVARVDVSEGLCCKKYFDHIPMWE
jgi:NAD(P)-dependent dehydrogenase (short-subunit alcohol dehydrogenase family)